MEVSPARSPHPPRSSSSCNSPPLFRSCILECFADGFSQRSCFGDSAADGDWSPPLVRNLVAFDHLTLFEFHSHLRTRQAPLNLSRYIANSISTLFRLPKPFISLQSRHDFNLDQKPPLKRSSRFWNSFITIKSINLEIIRQRPRGCPTRFVYRLSSRSPHDHPITFCATSSGLPNG